jgi:opacity protein-like surface antigen
MKKSIPLTLLGATLAANPASALDLGWRGYYLEADAGAVIQQDLTITSDVTSSSSKMTFSPGMRANVAFGGRFSDSFEVGIASGILWNSIDKIQQDSPNSSTLLQVPLLATVTYRLPLKGRWIPFVSGGVGGVMSQIDLKSSLANVNASDFTFAYQAGAGVRYRLGEKWELGLSYQMLATGDHDWSGGGVSLQTDGSMSHAFVLGATWKF